MKISEFVVESQYDGMKLEKYLVGIKGVSKRLLTKLKQTENGLLSNGMHIRSVDNVKCGDIIELNIKDSNSIIPNSDLKVPVIYEDENLVVFNKPVGMPVHPSLLHYNDTLGNFFTYLYPELSYRPVNRLDRDTSGLCAAAKNQLYASQLQRNIQKTYFAVVCGKLSQGGRIDLPISRKDDSIIMREVSENGQKAITDYTVIAGNEKYTLLRIKLLTGRTHQIRVHFSHIGYPLAGDSMYGGCCDDIKQQALHCGEMLLKLSDNSEKKLNAEIREEMKDLVRIDRNYI